MDIRYEKNHGHENIVRITFENEKFKCWETPLFGGPFMFIDEYDTFEEAKQIVDNLT